MNNKFLFISFILFFTNTDLHSQLESVFVERYYVADANDATDTTGGGVEQGSGTYRIFLKLLPGSKLLEIFGDAEHPFVISSSSPFFNNPDGGSFGNEIPKISYESNTVALDTYLTLGQTGFQGTKKYFGLPKNQDDDGSFIGGINNDGGSELIDGGLLINQDPSAGLPLTEADGMDTLNTDITDWFNFGILDFTSGADSTIFGDISEDTAFYSSNFTLRNSGVQGVIPDSNYILIAQLTTTGMLSFKLNAKVAIYGINDTTIVSYVGTNVISTENQLFNPYLIYPQICGCTDPDFVEYSPVYVCPEDGACLTAHVMGCTDSLACNYDPLATLNIAQLCCYPGFCAGRDIEMVCPHLKGETFDIAVYPNPTDDYLNLGVLSGTSADLYYSIFNYHGVEVKSEYIPNAPLNFTTTIDVSNFLPGIYTLQVKGNDGYKQIMFVRL